MGGMGVEGGWKRMEEEWRKGGGRVEGGGRKDGE